MNHKLTTDFRTNLSYKELKELVRECDLFISCDSFLQHLAYIENKRGIVIFSQSDPKIFGHHKHINIVK